MRFGGGYDKYLRESNTNAQIISSVEMAVNCKGMLFAKDMYVLNS